MGIEAASEFFTICPIGKFVDWPSDNDFFDPSVLPYSITSGATVEDVSSLELADAFKHWPRPDSLSEEDFSNLSRIQFAIVHRFMAPHGRNDELFVASHNLIRQMDACLRIVRPTRQRITCIRGEIGKSGRFELHGFDYPVDIMHLPECQKLFELRLNDLKQFRLIAPKFLQAYERDCWRFKMAVQFYEAGHFAQEQMWKVRFFLWVAALEALFTSSRDEHKGSDVAKNRIRFFLGAETGVFETGDIPSYLLQSSLTVGDVVEDIYSLRHMVAHGARIEDEWFRAARQGVNGEVCYAEQLTEALSFIARRSLYKILSEDLVDTFANETEWEKYFQKHELTRSAIKKKRKAIVSAPGT